MDVIINNPPAQAVPQVAVPQVVAPQVVPPTYQGYGYAPNPSAFGPYPSRDLDGPGFGPILLLLAGGFLLARARRRRHVRPAAPSANGQAPTAAPDSVVSWVKSGLFGDRSLDIARERLARGEITPEEYTSIRMSLAAE
ncbi:hypothetical protein [Deinococcus pimensis]|uniref:hypothetical protein n=1 Tax=Deinococcus pimensis TaxID=309888 RepID=UPI000487D7B7|nr:hypothetical protein [Deinococcus pimensis]